MIDLSILPAFLIAAIVLAASPGPDLLLISAYSSARGFTAGVMISLGIFTAGIVQTALVALGLGHIMQTMPLVAMVVKLVGAVYLAWLGLDCHSFAIGVQIKWHKITNQIPWHCRQHS
ncbi:LysE family translocator [Microbulbifer sp. CNSA002]|uniref:LysE family translocator n=1 Tax=unclassified Microbulbifer TaxID=2619833 RepID=UPI0039B37303